MNARIYTLTGINHAPRQREEPIGLHPSSGILTGLAISLAIWGMLLALVFFGV